MGRHQVTLTMAPPTLVEALRLALALKPASEGQVIAQRELVTSLEAALEARRQRIIISQSGVNWVKWTGLLVQAAWTLIAITMVHWKTGDGHRAMDLRDRCRHLSGAHRGPHPPVHRGYLRPARRPAASHPTRALPLTARHAPGSCR